MRILPQGQQPYIDTDRSPEEILENYYVLFAKHYRTWQKYDGTESVIAKAFTDTERKIIGELNKELIYSGYRIDTVLSSGEIQWLVMTKQILPETKINDKKIYQKMTTGNQHKIDDFLGRIGKKMPEAYCEWDELIDVSLGESG